MYEKDSLVDENENSKMYYSFIEIIKNEHLFGKSSQIIVVVKPKSLSFDSNIQPNHSQKVLLLTKNNLFF